VALIERRVLVLRPLGLGDLFTGLPAFRAIRRAFDGHEITLAAPAWQEPIARACGIDRTVDVDETGPLPCTEPVDVAINLHGCGPHSTQRLLDLAPGRLIAYRHRDVPETRSGPRWRRDDHEIERWCRLLRHHDIACDVADLRLRRPAPIELDHVGAVVVHPGAASTGRRWPAERFAQVVRTVVAHGMSVVLTGSPTEVDLCSAVRDLAGAPDGVTSVAGLTDLEGLCAVVASARAVVSNDTGVAHVAAAFAIPSITIFGPTSPQRWGQLDRSLHRCLWAGHEGDPHADELDPGLAAITADEVVALVDEVLGR
jgi:ADP-heptose:LPS heptosyltransferase